MIKNVSIIHLAVFSSLVGLYPFIYFFTDRKFGLLQTKSEAGLVNSTWNIAFYTHIILGGLALLLGWTQFISKWRKKKVKLHKNICKAYVSSISDIS